MINDVIFILGIAAAIGLAIGVERRWRGFSGSVPFHIAPALVGAWLVVQQPGLTHLFWFLPLQILMWLVVTAIVCMWSAERTPDVRGEFRGSGGLGLSWTLAFLLGVVCAFHAWFLVGAACVTMLVFGLRSPRRVVVVAAPVVTEAEAEKISEIVTDNPAHAALPGEAEEEAEAVFDKALAAALRGDPEKQRPAA